MGKDPSIEDEIKRATAGARAALIPVIATCRKLPGGDAVVRTVFDQIVKNTEELVRRAIFRDKMNATERARAEACIKVMHDELAKLLNTEEP